MGIENKVIRLIGDITTIDKMIMKTYQDNKGDYHQWENTIIEYLDNAYKNDNYHLEEFKKEISAHPYIQKELKKAPSAEVSEVFQLCDKLILQEFFANKHHEKFKKHTAKLFITHNETEGYGYDYAVYMNGLLEFFADNEMSLQDTKWLFECMANIVKKEVIEDNEIVNQYIQKNKKFPLWIHEIKGLKIK